MPEKTEWEIVDESSPKSGPQQPMPNLMKALLGPLWRWKVAGAITIAVVALVMLVMFAGIIVVVMTAGAIILLGIAKARQWLHRDNSALTRYRDR